MPKHVTTRQIRELLNIDLNGPGIGEDVQELIRRLTDGGVAGKNNDPRYVQAKRLWDLGLPKQVYQATGEEEWNSFKSFLAKVPPYPGEEPKVGKLVLVTEVSPVWFMQLLGVVHSCSDSERMVLESFSGSLQVHWVHMIDLRGPFEHRWVEDSEVPEDYVPATLSEGLCYFAQFGEKVLHEYSADSIVIDNGNYSFFVDEYGPQIVRHKALPLSPNVFVKRLT